MRPRGPGNEDDTVHAVQLFNYYIFTCVHMQVSDLLKRLIY